MGKRDHPSRLITFPICIGSFLWTYIWAWRQTFEIQNWSGFLTLIFPAFLLFLLHWFINPINDFRRLPRLIHYALFRSIGSVLCASSLPLLIFAFLIRSEMNLGGLDVYSQFVWIGTTAFGLSLLMFICSRGSYGRSLELKLFFSVVALVFVVEVWPTPYVYRVEVYETKIGEIAERRIRVNRFTGEEQSEMGNTWIDGRITAD